MNHRIHPVREERCVLLFLKAPEAGRVKTRLSMSLKLPTAVDLYKCFVADILGTLERTGHGIILCHDPPEKPDEIRNWLGDRHPLMPQRGKDLGGRMAEAFRSSFSRGVERAVLIGSDIPDLPPEFIDQAFTGLDDHDVVVGPAADGGYYLIGFRSKRFAPTVFDNISWSTPFVLEQTLEAIGSARLKCRLLPVWRDIDTREDLKCLIHNPGSERNAPNTLAYLSGMGLDEVSFGSIGSEMSKEKEKGSECMSDEKKDDQTARDAKVRLYGLSTCSHCKATKQFLDECTVKYNVIDVDLLDGEERKAIIEDVKKFNPRCSFPTIIIGERVIVGFKEQEIKEALGL